MSDAELTPDPTGAYTFPDWRGASYALLMCVRDPGHVGEQIGRAFEITLTATAAGVVIRIDWPHGLHWFLTSAGMLGVEGRGR